MTAGQQTKIINELQEEDKELVANKKQSKNSKHRDSRAKKRAIIQEARQTPKAKNKARDEKMAKINAKEEIIAKKNAEESAIKAAIKATEDFQIKKNLTKELQTAGQELSRLENEHFRIKNGQTQLANEQRRVSELIIKKKMLLVDINHQLGLEVDNTSRSTLCKCTGYCRATIEKSRADDKTVLLEGFAYLVGEAMIEKRNIYMKDSAWNYASDVIGFLPNLNDKGEKITTPSSTVQHVNRPSSSAGMVSRPLSIDNLNDANDKLWIAKEEQGLPGSHRLDFVSFYKPKCTGEAIDDGNECLPCKHDQQAFFKKCCAAFWMQNLDVHKNTKNKALLNSPGLLSSKIFGQTKNLRNLGNRLLRKASAILHGPKYVTHMANLRECFMDGENLETLCQQIIDKEEVTPDELSQLIFAEMCHQFQVGQTFGCHLEDTHLC